MMRQAGIALLSAIALAGCVTSSVEMLGDAPVTYETDACPVEVYASEALARQAGMTEEVCRAEGSSMFSLDHSVEVAVRRAAEKVCECGVSKAYIAAGYRHEGPSKATLVGFR